MSIIQGTSKAAGGAGYEIDQSIRFNRDDTATLTKTFGTATNRKIFTFSVWVKNGKSSGSIIEHNTTGGVTWANIQFGGNRIDYFDYSGGSARIDLRSTAVFRDPSAWYHLVVAMDTTQGTASNRLKFYINGSQITSFGTSTYPSLNFEGFINSSVPHLIGKGVNGPFDGYLAEYHFIDGQALAPTDFGEYNDAGVWIPKEYDGSYGTNGFYITGETAGDLGEDFSGNGNDFTSSGLTTTDQMLDTPTDNYATLNPLLKHSSVTLADGNLEASSGTNGWFGSVGTIGIQLGDKVYFEGKCLTNTRLYFGLSRINGTGGSINPLSSSTFEGNRSDTDYMWRVTSANTVYYQTTNESVTVSAVAVNDIVGCSVDTDGTVKFYKNGTEIHSFSTTLVAGDTYMPVYSVNGATSTEKWEVRFGSTSISHQPTGFNLLRTSDMDGPTIADGSAHFNPVLFTGNSGTAFSVTGVGFQPDFVWGKPRSYADNHRLMDVVRGSTKQIISNSTGAEFTQAQGITSFDSDGFTVGTHNGLNTGTNTYVGWCWLADNTTGSSNTDGSITSTVSANTTAGFSISTYTGTGSNATVGHGLGTAPSVILVKERTSGSVENWEGFFSAIGPTKTLSLNKTAAEQTSSTRWNDTSPTSSVFSIGTAVAVNDSSGQYVAYCFAEIPGYSSFGSYEGNGSTDGSFVYTGFRPSFLLVKNIDAVESWQIRDSKRDPFNVSKEILYPNTSGAEATSGGGQFADLLSNGFKWRGADPGNNSAATFIYMAFAEAPFGGAGIAPATAR